MRALVLEDSSMMRFILRRMLAQVGIDTVEEENGKRGLERLRSGSDIDLVFVDWHMPEMDGCDFVHAVRTDPALRKLRVLMVSSESSSQMIVKALQAGADEYVIKPFTFDTIVNKLTMMGLSVAPKR